MENNLIYQYFLPYTGDNKDIIKTGETGIPDWAEVGKQSAIKYAKKIGVQYEFSDQVTINAPNQNLEACRVFLDPYFDKFDKVLMLDIDTIVTTNKNIFKEKISDVGMIQEGGPNSPRGFISTVIRQLEKYGNIKFPKSKTNPYEVRYLNGGVVLWSKEGRLKARERFGGLEEMFRYRETLRMNEQPYLNLMLNLHNIEVTELDNYWNRMSYMWTFGSPDGGINHFLAKDKRKMLDYM